MYGNWSKLKSFNADLAGVLAMLDQSLPQQVSAAAPLHLHQAILLKDVHFRYSPTNRRFFAGSIWRSDEVKNWDYW